MEKELAMHGRNRLSSRTSHHVQIWCPVCDLGCVGEVGRCPVCGTKLSPKKHLDPRGLEVLREIDWVEVDNG